MWIEGRPLAIKPNLEEALRHLRLPNQYRRLWVDALCINQEDLGERSRQVGYMRLIYKHAARVIVWLALRTPGVDVAFELAQRLADIMDIGQTTDSSHTSAQQHATSQTQLEVSAPGASRRSWRPRGA